jgi:hypothetical protein
MINLLKLHHKGVSYNRNRLLGGDLIISGLY